MKLMNNDNIGADIDSDGAKIIDHVDIVDDDTGIVADSAVDSVTDLSVRSDAAVTAISPEQMLRMVQNLEIVKHACMQATQPEHWLNYDGMLSLVGDGGMAIAVILLADLKLLPIDPNSKLWVPQREDCGNGTYRLIGQCNASSGVLCRTITVHSSVGSEEPWKGRQKTHECIKRGDIEKCLTRSLFNAGASGLIGLHRVRISTLANAWKGTGKNVDEIPVAGYKTKKKDRSKTRTKVWEDDRSVDRGGSVDDTGGRNSGDDDSTSAAGANFGDALDALITRMGVILVETGLAADDRAGLLRLLELTTGELTEGPYKSFTSFSELSDVESAQTKLEVWFTEFMRNRDEKLIDDAVAASVQGAQSLKSVDDKTKDAVRGLVAFIVTSMNDAGADINDKDAILEWLNKGNTGQPYTSPNEIVSVEVAKKVEGNIRKWIGDNLVKPGGSEPEF
jgi:hypothetical protein